MSNNKIKLLTVIGARPQLMKAAMLSKSIDMSDDFNEILVHTGQHYDPAMSSSIISELFNRKPDYFLNSGGKDEISMTAYILEQTKKLILKENPNYIVVYGDTTSTLAVALAAKKLHIPLIHVESGVRNYDLSMPEEFNRIVVDRISDINICVTEHSFENLRREAFVTKEIPGMVTVCGDLMLDCFKFFQSHISKSLSSILTQNGLNTKNYILFTIHRQSNVDNKESLKNIVKALNKIHSHIPVLIPLHHRTRMRLEQFNLKLECCVIDPVSYLDSLSLLRDCKFVITDSGGLVREAFFAKKVSLSILEDAVWPEISNLKASVNTRPNTEEIEAKFLELSNLEPDFKKLIFGNGDAAKKILTDIRLHFSKVKLKNE